MYWHQGCVITATVSIQREGGEGAGSYLRRCEFMVQKEFLNSSFLYLRECEYRSHMYSHKIYFLGNCFLHVLVLCWGVVFLIKGTILPSERKNSRLNSHKIESVNVSVSLDREAHSMDQYRSRPKLSENFDRMIGPYEFQGKNSYGPIIGPYECSWGNSYGPMVLKVLPKFPPTLVLVHGWLFSGTH